jgi:biotin carboxyl carrier protein
MASLIALTELENSYHRILSPVVGIYYSFPARGTFLSAGSFIGKLRVFNTIYDLFLPQNVMGEVVFNGERVYDLIEDRIIPVEYGQELFRLNPEIGDSLRGRRSTRRKRLTDLEEKVAETTSTDSETLEKGHVITAFTTGIFYRKSSPDARPYVEEGQTVEKGKVLGLIEVMKTFNHIVFHGSDSSESGKIKKIFVKDSQEVKLNQPLFLIEPEK